MPASRHTTSRSLFASITMATNGEDEDAMD
jgi:hypothetical protein